VLLIIFRFLGLHRSKSLLGVLDGHSYRLTLPIDQTSIEGLLGTSRELQAEGDPKLMAGEFCSITCASSFTAIFELNINYLEIQKKRAHAFKATFRA
jgi:hypothetical protein